MRRRCAQLLAGGQAQAGSQFYPPTVLADVPREARIWREEAFGPVLLVVKGAPPPAQPGRLAPSAMIDFLLG